LACITATCITATQPSSLSSLPLSLSLSPAHPYPCSTPSPHCADGYSTSRTCEMSLSNHSGIDFRGMVYLVDEATKAKKAPAAVSESA